MVLLELAAQGLDGLGAGRWPFRPGLNAVSGAPAASEAVVRVLVGLFFPETQPFGGPAGARAGVTFVAANGGTYRLVGGTGTEVALSKLDDATSRFMPVETGGGVSRQLRNLGLPERRLFEPLFFFAEVPSAPAAQAEPTIGGGGSGRGIESRLAELTADIAETKPKTLFELRQRLSEVEAEERSAHELEQLQFQLDGLQQRLFQAEDSVRAVDQARSEFERIGQELGKMPAVSEEAVAQVARLPQLVQKRDETLRRIAEERLAISPDGGRASLAALGQDRLFVASLGVGAGSLAAAVLGSSFLPGMRWLALLDIPGLGVAVFRACQQLSALRRQEGAARKLALLDEREQRTQRAFAAEAKEAQALMKALGAEGAAELEQRLAERAAMLERQGQASAKLAASERDEGVRAAMAARDDLRREVAELEAKLAAFGGYRRDAAEVRREATALRDEIARQGGAEPADIELSEDGRPPPDEAAALFRRAAEVFGMTPAMLLQTVRDRAAQYVGALSERRYGAPAFLPDGSVALSRPGSEALPFAQVAEADRRPCLWGLRLVLAERYLFSHRMFLVIDERIAGLDPARGQLLARMAQGLARAAQVIWLGESAASLASHAVVLG